MKCFRFCLAGLLTIYLAGCASIKPNPEAVFDTMSPVKIESWQMLGDGRWLSEDGSDAFLWSKQIDSAAIEVKFTYTGKEILFVVSNSDQPHGWHRNTSIVNVSDDFFAIRKHSIYSANNFVLFQRSNPVLKAGRSEVKNVHLVVVGKRVSVSVNGVDFGTYGLPYGLQSGGVVGIARYGGNSPVLLENVELASWVAPN